MNDRNTDRPTMPPSRNDHEATEFERAVQARGESRARLDRILALLEGTEKAA